MAMRMLYLHALSPLHPGTGQGAGVIDLPVARRKVPGWPYIPASTLKGVVREASAPSLAVREAVRRWRRDRGTPRPSDDDLRAMANWDRAFGTADEPEDAEPGEGVAPQAGMMSRAGLLAFTDAQLLCFPVRSYHGSFAWVTCPLALRLWARDRQVENAFATLQPQDSQILLPQAGSVMTDGAQGPMVYLEDYDLTATRQDAVKTLAEAIAGQVFAEGEWRGEFARRFGVVSDDLFAFLTETATEVVARIRLDEQTKTVASGGLWYEEQLPAETIFACPLVTPDRANGAEADAIGLIATSLRRPDGAARALQVGGKASVGRGIVELRLGE